MRKNKFSVPRWIVKDFGSARKFCADHRRRLKAVQQALNVARVGCAFTPTRAHLQQIQLLLDDAIEVSRPSKWEARKRGASKSSGAL